MAGAPDLADAASNSAPSGIKWNQRRRRTRSVPFPSLAGEASAPSARLHHASSTNKHALARADRKIVRRGASGSGIGKVPPFMIVICKALFAHGLEEHLAPAPLFGADGGARGVARGIEAVEARACMSSEHFGQLAWQFKRVSGSSGLKVQAAIAC
jgi:hypothetical protein